MAPHEGTKKIIEEQKPSIADMVNARFRSSPVAS